MPDAAIVLYLFDRHRRGIPYHITLLSSTVRPNAITITAFSATSYGVLISSTRYHFCSQDTSHWFEEQRSLRPPRQSACECARLYPLARTHQLPLPLSNHRPASHMSATVADTAQRPLPLTPPNQLDGIDLSLPSKMSFQLPQTPQSPSQPGKASPAESTYTSVGPMALPTPAHSVSGASTSQLSNMPSPDSSKRKREPEDAGNREQRKKIRAEDRELSIQDLHLDVGKKYLLCRTRKTPLLKTLPLWCAVVF